MHGKLGFKDGERRRGRGGTVSSRKVSSGFTLGVSLGRRSKKLAELRVIVSIPTSL